MNGFERRISITFCWGGWFGCSPSLNTRLLKFSAMSSARQNDGFLCNVNERIKQWHVMVWRMNVLVTVAHPKYDGLDKKARRL